MSKQVKRYQWLAFLEESERRSNKKGNNGTSQQREAANACHMPQEDQQHGAKT